MSDDTPAAHLAPVRKRGPLETKVPAGAAGAGLGGATASLANWALGQYAFHGNVPGEVSTWVSIVVPLVLAGAFAYLAPHTRRPDTSPED